MAHAFRVANSVGNSDGPALRDAHQHKFVYTRGVDHGLQIMHPGLERNVPDLPVGDAIAAFIVADDRVMFAQFAEPVPPHRAVPLKIQVVQPIRGLYERVPRPRRRIRDAYTVARDAESNFLARPRSRHATGSLWSWRRGDFGDRRDKSISDARQSFDVRLPGRLLPQRLSQDRDIVIEISFLHRHIRPQVL